MGTRLKEVCKKAVRQGFTVIPYYANVSLMAYRTHSTTCLSGSESWEDLARIGIAWEEEHTNKLDLFFDFPKGIDENYNCLFLEILFERLNGEIPKSAQISDLLRPEECFVASKIFRTLCRRAFRSYYLEPTGQNRNNCESQIPKVAQTAIVWRHWFTTLRQMLDEMPVEFKKRSKFDLYPATYRLRVNGPGYPKALRSRRCWCASSKCANDTTSGT